MWKSRLEPAAPDWQRQGRRSPRPGSPPRAALPREAGRRPAASSSGGAQAVPALLPGRHSARGAARRRAGVNTGGPLLTRCAVWVARAV